eukprot:TRINITY_DN23068_c0_g1_i1.p2 TRINITY_DN23068_c0_g1~~TRINITY_DN23068_c0_g1_i1.p2  ORF type:complete len:244 (+),score=32.50 TRINITY_DN23068_c0_g1_i1:71-802(+)
MGASWCGKPEAPTVAGAVRFAGDESESEGGLSSAAAGVASSAGAQASPSAAPTASSNGDNASRCANDARMDYTAGPTPAPTEEPETPDAAGSNVNSGESNSGGDPSARSHGGDNCTETPAGAKFDWSKALIDKPDPLEYRRLCYDAQSSEARRSERATAWLDCSAPDKRLLAAAAPHRTWGAAKRHIEPPQSRTRGGSRPRRAPRGGRDGPCPGQSTAAPSLQQHSAEVPRLFRGECPRLRPR